MVKGASLSKEFAISVTKLTVDSSRERVDVMFVGSIIKFSAMQCCSWSGSTLCR